MERVVKKLIEDHKTISTMESCTGGIIANAITNIPDASQVIKFSAVTYSNEFKIKMGVDSKLIEKYSVYSMEVARNMAKTISSYTNSNYGIGVTGKLNKPDPNNMYGDDNAVFVAIYDKDKDMYMEKKIILEHESRVDNKNQVLNEVIKLLIDLLFN